MQRSAGCERSFNGCRITRQNVDYSIAQSFEDVARARREWDKLAKEEQQTAIDRIEEVYYHTNETRFIPLASTYLKDKAFLNEYTN